MTPSATPANYRRLVASSATSNLADGAFILVLALVALSLTRSPSEFAYVTVVGRLPWLFFALPAGALADRLDRRKTMIRVNVFRAVAIGLLAAVVAADQHTLWMLYVVAFALGTGETLFDTAAQSMMPRLVHSDDLAKANGRLYAAELTTNQFVGPPLGALIASAALAAAIATSSLLYLVAALILGSLSGSFKTERGADRPNLRSDIREGITYLAQHKLLRILAICVGVSNLASTAMIAVLPLYVIEPGPLGASETGYSLLLAAIAAGSLLGTLVVERLAAWLGTRRMLLVSTLSFPLFSLAPLASSTLWLVGAILFGGAAIAVTWNIITVSLRQRIVPDQILGRANAGYRLVAWGTMPVGAALGGLIASRYGIPATLVTSAAVSSICTIIVFFGATTERLKEAG